MPPHLVQQIEGAIKEEVGGHQDHKPPKRRGLGTLARHVVARRAPSAGCYSQGSQRSGCLGRGATRQKALCPAHQGLFTAVRWQRGGVGRFEKTQSQLSFLLVPTHHAWPGPAAVGGGQWRAAAMALCAVRVPPPPPNAETLACKAPAAPPRSPPPLHAAGSESPPQPPQSERPAWVERPQAEAAAPSRTGLAVHCAWRQWRRRVASRQIGMQAFNATLLHNLLRWER